MRQKRRRENRSDGTGGSTRTSARGRAGDAKKPERNEERMDPDQAEVQEGREDPEASPGEEAPAQPRAS